jgi:hypothetical protein
MPRKSESKYVACLLFIVVPSNGALRSMGFSATGRSKPTPGKQGSPAKGRIIPSARAR